MKKIDFNIPSERITGITIPEKSRFYICDHDEVFEANITDVVRIKVTEHDPYEFAEGSSSLIGLKFTNTATNLPIKSVGKNWISYNFNRGDDFVTVEYNIAGRTGSIKFVTFSGSWFCASFSRDGRHIILAEPYDIALYQVES